MRRRFYPPTESDIPMHGWRPYHEIHRERIRAHAKHDGNGDSMERKEFDDYGTWITVLVEEVGEVAKVFCDQRHLGQFADREALAEELRAELVQVAAMTVAWIEAIDLRGTERTL
jgi:NTP pyrophosphatase (non-canonical NTP hydrolase)